MPLTRGADGSLGVRAVGRESPAVQDAARQIEAQPRIAVSVDARSTFTGQPDDATMLAVDEGMLHWNSGSSTPHLLK
jgi:phage-related minor tail protein